jgi:hypothetical protein
MKKPAHWLMEKDSHKHGQRVNQIKVQNVEEHGHVAEGQKD